MPYVRRILTYLCIRLPPPTNIPPRVLEPIPLKYSSVTTTPRRGTLPGPIPGVMSCRRPRKTVQRRKGGLRIHTSAVRVAAPHRRSGRRKDPGPGRTSAGAYEGAAQWMGGRRPCSLPGLHIYVSVRLPSSFEPSMPRDGQGWRELDRLTTGGFPSPPPRSHPYIVPAYTHIKEGSVRLGGGEVFLAKCGIETRASASVYPTARRKKMARRLPLLYPIYLSIPTPESGQGVRGALSTHLSTSQCLGGEGGRRSAVMVMDGWSCRSVVLRRGAAPPRVCMPHR